MKIRALSKRFNWWTGFLAVLLPLAILLGLQYRWLRALDRFSERAHKAQVASLLEAVSKNVEYAYADAGQILDLQPTIFTQHQLDRAGHLFKKKGVVGVTSLFVMSLRDEKGPLFFTPGYTTSSLPDCSPEALAVSVAVAHGTALYRRDGALERVRLFVEEKDPSFRILLYPITDDSSRLVGLAGMILDQRYFREKVLPKAVRDALSEFS